MAQTMDQTTADCEDVHQEAFPVNRPHVRMLFYYHKAVLLQWLAPQSHSPKSVKRKNT